MGPLSVSMTACMPPELSPAGTLAFPGGELQPVVERKADTKTETTGQTERHEALRNISATRSRCERSGRADNPLKMDVLPQVLYRKTARCRQPQCRQGRHGGMLECFILAPFATVELTCAWTLDTRHVLPQESLGRARSCDTRAEPARPAALSLESARRGSPHHEFRRRQYQLEIRAAGSADRTAAAGHGRRAAAATCARSRPPVSRSSISTSSKRSFRAIEARRTRTRWSRSIRCARSARIASPLPSTRRCTRSSRFHTSTICTRTGRSRYAASANGATKLQEFNQRYGRRIAWCSGSAPGSSSR